MKALNPLEKSESFWQNMLYLTLMTWLLALYTFSIYLIIAATFLTLGVARRGIIGKNIFSRFSSLKHLAEHHALEEWQGNYYSFNNQQIRIIDAREKRWVVAQDLVQAAGLKYNAELKRKLPLSYTGYRQIPDSTLMGFDQEAALKFLEGKQQNNAEVIKLKLWLEREVFGELAMQQQHSKEKQSIQI